jgi:hypothetical protein
MHRASEAKIDQSELSIKNATLVTGMMSEEF